MAAKQGATIDHISGGRFNLNIVTGWYQPEIEMFGEPMMEHDLRYDRAAEWLDVIKLLWTREDEFDYEGKYYNIKKGWLAPKPLQQPYPVVMCAGASERGKAFAARECDVAFTVVQSHEPDVIRAQIADYKTRAREHGRDIQVWTNCYIVQGDTEDDAKNFVQHYVHDEGDWEAAENLVTMLGINSQSLPPGVAQQLKAHFIAGWGGVPVVGTKEQIVDKLGDMMKLGFDGVILSWAKYVEGMREFQATTYPLLVQAGLR
jgi:alkanesulfonate monooxygenase SsuD/methylene tetrahydromethanopterin reductase-like flavin-dependent oxidoreductase (luciferase family)